MITLLIAPAVLLAVAWLISEFKGGKRVRIMLGLLTIVVGGYLVHCAALVEWDFARGWYAVSLRQAEGLLLDGDTNTVLRAIRAHNVTAQTGTVYQATQTFMSEISDTHRKTP